MIEIWCKTLSIRTAEWFVHNCKELTSLKSLSFWLGSLSEITFGYYYFNFRGLKTLPPYFKKMTALAFSNPWRVFKPCGTLSPRCTNILHTSNLYLP